MLRMNYRLAHLEEQGKPILAGIVGAGQMGRGLIAQIQSMKGMRGVVLADHTLEKAKNAFYHAGVSPEQVASATTLSETNALLSQGKFVACEDHTLAVQNDFVSCVVDATGVPDAGAVIAMDAIRAGKHIVMLNVETDVTIGPVLKKEADSAGVIYTGSLGDEPGSVKEMYDFADALGFSIKVIGKGKNNPVDYKANPDSVMEEAIARGMAPKMLASFKDGTKTMVELCAMCNATGFLPDRRGACRLESKLDGLDKKLCVQSEGGVLNRYKTVAYVDGIAPGVFIIVSSDKQDVHHELQYLKIGTGPNYVLYRPYHLCSLETPLTIAAAVLDHTSSIVPMEGLLCEAMSVAKIDLKAGQYLDGIGGFSAYGTIDTHQNAKRIGALPVGLLNTRTKMVRDVKKGELITYDDVLLDETSPALALRRRQDAIFG